MIWIVLGFAAAIAILWFEVYKNNKTIDQLELALDVQANTMAKLIEDYAKTSFTLLFIKAQLQSLVAAQEEYDNLMEEDV